MLCFKDNVAAGGRFMYSRTYTKPNISVNIDEDTNFDISNLYELRIYSNCCFEKLHQFRY